MVHTYGPTCNHVEIRNFQRQTDGSHKRTSVQPRGVRLCSFLFLPFKFPSRLLWLIQINRFRLWERQTAVFWHLLWVKLFNTKIFALKSFGAKIRRVAGDGDGRVPYSIRETSPGGSVVGAWDEPTVEKRWKSGPGRGGWGETTFGMKAAEISAL